MQRFDELSRYFTLNGNVRDAEVLFEFVLEKADLVRSSEVAHQCNLLVLVRDRIELILQLCAIARSDHAFFRIELRKL